MHKVIGLLETLTGALLLVFGVLLYAYPQQIFAYFSQYLTIIAAVLTLAGILLLASKEGAVKQYYDNHGAIPIWGRLSGKQKMVTVGVIAILLLVVVYMIMPKEATPTQEVVKTPVVQTSTLTNGATVYSVKTQADCTSIGGSCYSLITPPIEPGKQLGYCGSTDIGCFKK